MAFHQHTKAIFLSVNNSKGTQKAKKDMTEIEYNIYPKISEKSIEQQFEQDNFLIENTTEKSNLAVIYFSSHGLYFPNEQEVFEEELVRKNKFEYYNHRISRAQKHIFVRDILKQFYVRGINKKIDSIDKLVSFLEKETKNMDVITVGSSAGALLALISGIRLGAKTVFAFSPIVNIYDSFDNASDFEAYKTLKNHENDEAYSKYYDISGLIKGSKVPIVYFYPTNCPIDKKQLASLPENQSNIIKIGVKSNNHGDIIRGKALLGYLNSTAEELILIKKFFLKKENSKPLLKFVFMLKYTLNKLLKEGEND